MVGCFMKGDPVPDSDHVARFCRPAQVSNGEIQATAFMLRASEPNLSVNWLEILNCSDRAAEIREIQKIYQITFKVGPNARIAVLNVGEVRNIVRSETPDNRVLEVLHDPILNDPMRLDDESHSEIRNLKVDDEFIAELILEVLRENHPARPK